MRPWFQLFPKLPVAVCNGGDPDPQKGGLSKTSPAGVNRRPIAHTEWRPGSHRHRRRPPRHGHRSSAVAPWAVRSTAYRPTGDLALAPAAVPGPPCLVAESSPPGRHQVRWDALSTRPSPATSSPGAVPARRATPARCGRPPPRPSSTTFPPPPSSASPWPPATTSGISGRFGVEAGR